MNTAGLSPKYGMSDDGETITLRKFKPVPYPECPQENGGELLTYLDVETTGLDRAADEVIELALVQFTLSDEGRILGVRREYQGLQQPSKPLPQEITRITGITDAMLKNQKIDWDFITGILSESKAIFAHNAAFDRPFIDRYCTRKVPVLWGCSMSQIQWTAYGHRSRSLEQLCRDHGFFYDAHRAMSDIQSALHLLQFPSPGKYPTHFMEMIATAAEPDFHVLATKAPFEAKDRLKQMGFRWNPEDRVWHKMVSALDLKPVLEWMEIHVYDGTRNQPTVIEKSASERFR